MLVGEPFGCKTMVIETLCEGMSLLNEQGHSEEFEKVHFKIINPKAVTMGQLFGQFDPVSHEVSFHIFSFPHSLPTLDTFPFTFNQWDFTISTVQNQNLC